MDERLIENYNSVVNNFDTVIFVGDVFFCNYPTAKDIMSRLNGTKILVRGNHDSEPSTMYKLGFDFVCENMRMKIGKTRVNVCHYPYLKKPWNHYFKYLIDKNYKYKANSYKRIPDDGLFLIHGHTHRTEQIQGREINVCVEAWDYKPVPITNISSLIDRSNNENKKG